jgi:hypothetical protein
VGERSRRLAYILDLFEEPLAQLREICGASTPYAERRLPQQMGADGQSQGPSLFRPRNSAASRLFPIPASLSRGTAQSRQTRSSLRSKFREHGCDSPVEHFTVIPSCPFVGPSRFDVSPAPGRAGGSSVSVSAVRL